jgi:PAS domain S-box-containing protein
VVERAADVVMAVVLISLTIGLLRQRRLVRPRHIGFDHLLAGLCLISLAAVLQAVGAEELLSDMPWWSGLGAVLRDFVGFVLGIVLVGVGLWLWIPALIRHQREMTARLEAEQRLLEEERRYRQVVDAMPGLYFMYDRDGQLVDWNPRGASLVGRTAEEMRRLKLTDLARPEHRSRVRQAVDRGLEVGEGSVEFDARLPDGTIVPLLAAGRVIRVGDEDRIVGLAIDISDLKRAEKELERHVEFERLLLEISTRMINIPTSAIDDAISDTLREICRFAGVDGGYVFLRSADGRSVSLTHSWHTGRLNYQLETLQGLPLDGSRWTVQRLIEERQPLVVSRLDELPPEAAPERELNQAAGVEAYVSVPLVYGDEVVGTFGFDVAEGPRTWTDTELSLLKMVGQIISNALQRKRTDERLQQLNVELEDRVRRRTLDLETVNRELEAFAHSVSHDLRAPVRAIVGFSQAVLEDQADRVDETGRDYLHRVIAAGRRLGEMIDALLTLSRASRAELKTEDVDLGSLARSIINDLRVAAPDREVEVYIADGLEAHGDTRLLGLVVQNLLENAWKFSSGCEVARIEVGAGNVTGPDGVSQRAFFVRDNGIGFDIAHADQLFVPFQRLHGADGFPGTGIGLATVQRIVHRHGGAVWAESEAGRGATFSFTLGDPAP